MHPYLEIAGRPVLVWGLCVTVGVFLCWALLVRRTARLGYGTPRVLAWLILAFPVGALGALGLSSLVLLIGGATSSGGMTVLGAIVACAIWSALYVRVAFGEAPWRLLDAAAFTFSLASLCGRLGCLWNGCCFGDVAGAGVPHWLTLASEDYVAPSLAAASLPHGVRVWNLPLLFIVAQAVTLAAVELCYRRARWPVGAVAALAIAADALGRVGIEVVRFEPDFGAKNPWRLLALALGAAALAIFVWRVRLGPRDQSVAKAP